MNKEQLIKWGLVLAGLYLIYEYAQSHGGFAALLGQTPAAGGGDKLPEPKTFVQSSAGQQQQQQTTTTTQTHDTPPVTATVDLTGLVVTKDINDSLAGTVKINGVPTRLAIIQADGRIFDNSGQEVTTKLAGQGIDVDKLRAAFTAAGAGLGMFAPMGNRPRGYWLM
jgi:hypothetical protein